MVYIAASKHHKCDKYAERDRYGLNSVTFLYSVIVLAAWGVCVAMLAQPLERGSS